MPRQKSHRHSHIHMDNNGTKGFRISFAALGAIGTAFALIIGLWQISARVATKSDIDSIRVTISPVLDRHENRIRDLELQMARTFGASPMSAVPRANDIPAEPDTLPTIHLAQFQTAQIPNVAQMPIPPTVQRRVVVPVQLIEMFNLEPTRGGVYALLGEDGRYYGLDDVLAVIIRLHLRERAR